MTKKDKLLKRLLEVPKDFTFEELTSVFTKYGFKIGTKGKTSGSRIEFYNEEIDVKYYAHKPHPKNIVKPYVIKQVIEFLEKLDLL